MKSIISNFIKKLQTILIKDIHRPLGRWRIENCNKRMNNKIDLSNEDHCGPCGQYALEKIEAVDSKKVDNNDIFIKK
jgi:hypothetical protein